MDADPIFRGIIKGVYTPFALRNPYRLVGASEKTKERFEAYYERIHLYDRMRSIYYQYFKYDNCYIYLMEDGIDVNDVLYFFVLGFIPPTGGNSENALFQAVI